MIIRCSAERKMAKNRFLSSQSCRRRWRRRTRSRVCGAKAVHPPRVVGRRGGGQRDTRTIHQQPRHDQSRFGLGHGNSRFLVVASRSTSSLSTGYTFVRTRAFAITSVGRRFVIVFLLLFFFSVSTMFTVRIVTFVRQ